MTSLPTTKAGFTLVEVLVSITILLLVIVTPLQIISRTINTTSFATEQINAWFLAQEGLELTQKGRDDLVLSNFKQQINPPGETAPMAQFLTDYAFCFGAGGCGLTVGNGALAPTSIVNCTVLSYCKLYLSQVGGSDRSSYVHTATGNSVTPYTRVITMVRTPASGKVREIKVTSTITWRTGSLIAGQKVEVTSYLFNVYDSN